MNQSSINLVLQSAWRALEHSQPSATAMQSFCDVVFRVRSDCLNAHDTAFTLTLTELARVVGAMNVNKPPIEAIAVMLEILHAECRRQVDQCESLRLPAAVFIPDYGRRALFFAQGLLSSGLDILSLVSNSSLTLSEALQGTLPRSGVILVGDVVLHDPQAAEEIKQLTAEYESELLVVIAADTPLTFNERLAASEFGAVRVLGPDADLKTFRALVQARERDSQLHGHRVLLLDDSRTDAYVAQKYMREEGLEVMHIQNPAEILDAIYDFRPDVIVTDYHMPGINGDQVASVIRQDSTAIMPIVFLSSERNGEVQLQALAKGADAFVQKPLRRGSFIRALKSMIARSKAAETLMHRDPLTGLLNHGQFMASAARAAVQKGDVDKASLVMIDIDHFKTVNDTFGHPVGDLVLVALGEILRDNLRASDIVGRLGGEEFAVVMPGAGVEDAKVVIERIRNLFSSVQFPSDAGSDAVATSFACTFSAGIAPLVSGVSKTMCEADELLYQAKSQGRNRVQA